MHAKLMEKIVHGQPNIYAFFMALAARLLKPDGEIVAITPRSFCNGLYFREFRRWFLERVALDHIHIFESRTETFKHSSVLQENIITRARKPRHAFPDGRRSRAASERISTGRLRPELKSPS